MQFDTTKFCVVIIASCFKIGEKQTPIALFEGGAFIIVECDSPNLQSSLGQKMHVQIMNSFLFVSQRSILRQSETELGCIEEMG